MKMKRFRVLVLTLLFVAFGVSGAWAVEITLYDWAFNVNGTKFESVQGTNNFSILPNYFNYGSFTQSTGLGTITITYNPGTIGNHYLLAFFDHEIDQPPFSNETGATTGTSVAGQSWEIDEPGWVKGDIYENFEDNALDNEIGISIYGNTIFPDDVSMAMGWDFTLASGEWAVITLSLGETAPAGFYLQHTDPDSQYSLYLSSGLEVRGGGNVIPEPGTMLLLGSGVVGLFGLGRKRFKKS
jgi:hypothetical protein